MMAMAIGFYIMGLVLGFALYFLVSSKKSIWGWIVIIITGPVWFVFVLVKLFWDFLNWLIDQLNPL